MSELRGMSYTEYEIDFKERKVSLGHSKIFQEP